MAAVVPAEPDVVTVIGLLDDRDDAWPVMEAVLPIAVPPGSRARLAVADAGAPEAGPALRLARELTATIIAPRTDVLLVPGGSLFAVDGWLRYEVRDHVLTDRPWLAADPILGPWRETADLDVLQTGAWILPDERPLPADLVAFLDAGSPPVYVGFGSMRAPWGIAAVAIEAIRAQGHRVLVGRGWAGLAPIDDAEDCFVVGEVNQQALFRQVAAVVHHGGAGTLTTAARAGAPQVVVPLATDQPYWAGRVADLGIGAAHAGPTPTVESLSAALRAALNPETRTRATAVAGTIRTDGAARAARLLLDAAD
ncbi:glycosyltransferase [Micromonospora luteifusca]|uniref:glycosyltransferase n=1 Tax=Micromonospora luteifusca TaxID=709860 RepID=UPI0033A85D5C